MRLTCPNCKAQYEVDASVIPATGRDVQCSNCGRTWFQKAEAGETAMPAGVADDSAEWADTEEAGAEIGEPEPSGHAAAPDETAPDAAADAAPAAMDDLPEPDDRSGAGQAATASEAATAQDPVTGDPPADATAPTEVVAPAEDLAEPVPTPGSAAAAPAPRRQTLDDAVLNVLREEAAREARARQAEGSAIETQSDLGLTAAIASTIAASRGDAPGADDRAADDHGSWTTRDRVARLNDDADDIDEADHALMSRGSRRELLPDIEEINSTLRATSDRGNEAAARDTPETLRRRRSGFRLGFSTALVVAVFLLAVYVLAPVIAARAPALEPALTRYVGAVDRARVWLDARMKSTTESMRGAP